MHFARITERGILNLIEQMKASGHNRLSTGDVVILRTSAGEVSSDACFEVIRIAERRLYNTEADLFYFSTNDNYKEVK